MHVISCTVETMNISFKKKKKKVNKYLHEFGTSWNDRNANAYPINSGVLFKPGDSQQAGLITKLPKTKTSVSIPYTTSAKVPQPQRSQRDLPSPSIPQLNIY